MSERIIFILRHGKSSWEALGISDIDRPLLDVGICNTHLIGNRLHRKDVKIDMIISSPAARAIHSALIIARCIEMKSDKVVLNDLIYTGEKNTILDIIEKLPESIKNVLIVGHNPVFTDLANIFLPKPVDNIPTSGLVTLTFEKENWDIRKSKPVHWDFDYPKKE
jgi:phosphohistidine phosphatase